MDPLLAKLQQEIASAAGGLSPHQLSWHRSGKWSAAEILEHLYLTYTGTIKGFGRVLEAGKPLATVLTWKQRARGFIVIGLGYMPSGREAPAVARPRGIPPQKVMTEIVAKIGEMDEIMARCEQQFGARGKLLDHPVLGPCSLRQWRKFHLVHGRHHIAQIYRLREDITRNPDQASGTAVSAS
jgi:hypothetical protein